MDCNCPNPDSLTTITPEDCGVNLTQIQKIAFQREGTLFDTGATIPTDIKELADWQTLIAAVDDTKIVVTPFIGGDPVIEAGEAITNGGGDNSTLNGIAEVDGANPSAFSCIFKSLSSLVESQLKSLVCEKALTAYLFLQGGKIAAVQITVDVAYKGFKAESLFVGDRSNAGFSTSDAVAMSFSLPQGWSDSLVIIEPNFNPLTDL